MWFFGPTLAASLELLFIIEIWLVLVCLIGTTLNRFTRISFFFFLILLAGLLDIPIGCLIFVSPFLDGLRMPIPTVYFFIWLDT